MIARCRTLTKSQSTKVRFRTPVVVDAGSLGAAPVDSLGLRVSHRCRHCGRPCSLVVRARDARRRPWPQTRPWPGKSRRAARRGSGSDPPRTHCKLSLSSAVMGGVCGRMRGWRMRWVSWDSAVARLWLPRRTPRLRFLSERSVGQILPVSSQTSASSAKKMHRPIAFESLCDSCARHPEPPHPRHSGFQTPTRRSAQHPHQCFDQGCRCEHEPDDLHGYFAKDGVGRQVALGLGWNFAEFAGEAMGGSVRSAETCLRLRELGTPRMSA